MITYEYKFHHQLILSSTLLFAQQMHVCCMMVIIRTPNEEASRLVSIVLNSKKEFEHHASMIVFCMFAVATMQYVSGTTPIVVQSELTVTGSALPLSLLSTGIQIVPISHKKTKKKEYAF